MVKMGKGPESLRVRMEQELDASPPPWDDLQPQAKEYARLAASLGQYTPEARGARIRGPRKPRPSRIMPPASTPPPRGRTTTRPRPP